MWSDVKRDTVFSHDLLDIWGRSGILLAAIPTFYWRMLVRRSWGLEAV